MICLTLTPCFVLAISIVWLVIWLQNIYLVMSSHHFFHKPFQQMFRLFDFIFWSNMTYWNGETRWSGVLLHFQVKKPAWLILDFVPLLGFLVLQALYLHRLPKHKQILSAKPVILFCNKKIPQAPFNKFGFHAYLS